MDFLLLLSALAALILLVYLAYAMLYPDKF